MSKCQTGCHSDCIFQRIFPKSGKQIHSWHGFVKYFFDVRSGTGTFPSRYLFAPHFGDAIKVSPAGRDITFLAHGTVLPEAITAAERLALDGLHVGLFSMPVVEPLDQGALIEAATTSRVAFLDVQV